MHFFVSLHMSGKSSTFAPEMGKRIVYMAPVEWMAGNLSGRQSQPLEYGDAAHAYDVAVGTTHAANVYEPRLIVQYRRKSQARYFTIRTRTSVNMTAANKANLAEMGGAGALFASLMRNKSAEIYAQCVAACPKRVTLRAFLIPLLRAGLRNKVATITIADGVGIVNPWISSAEPNVPVTSASLDKFASELSNQ